MHDLARITVFGTLLGAASLLGGCAPESDARDQEVAASSCIKCHNGSKEMNYAGPGIENPHPFPGADNLSCVECHGGDNQGVDEASSHVPPPPGIGDREYQKRNREAWFNKLTLTGLDKYDDYTVNGKTYSAIDYLQFVNPGDLRVTTKGRACGKCHQGHSETVNGSVLATETGVFSGALFAAGVANFIAENQNKFEDTAADLAFRQVVDPAYVYDANKVGQVGKLIEYPVCSERGKEGDDQLFRNPAYNAAALAADIDPATNKLISNSRLADLYREQIAFTCGDCHLGSSGANNRSGDYRSSGCTSCHMPYSLGGRAGSKDPNINKLEPLDPDDIDDGERPHTRSHKIVSTHRTLSNGHQQTGIDDLTCAGCHQGSNRTVMQYWGIRLDQNQDVRRRQQYPANPVSFKNTANDTRLFDPDLNNREFNGRNANQYLAFEDYDGDGRDDTPADVHHEAGMGCIDCHGSFDLHGGDVKNGKTDLMSRMEHTVSIQCENCHGDHEKYAPTTPGTAIDGTQKDLAVDRNGRAINHVFKDADGHYYMISKLTGKKHYVKQTLDTIQKNGRTNPMTNEEIYNVIASYAMGKDDGDPATGIGPQQTGNPHAGFSHLKNMSCASCHSAWTNTCAGCHLEGEYNTGNNFSNITGKRIVFREKNADFVYQSPIPFTLGVAADNKIKAFSTNTKVFFSYEDLNNDRSKVFSFSDRKGMGNKPGTFGAMGHNAMMAHSIRGKVTDKNEGPRYCVSCHLTNATAYSQKYTDFRTAMATNDFANLDFDILKEEIGKNPGNQKNSPIFVHMVAGLGSGIFLFDEKGCPQNPLDDNDNRAGCEGVSPKDRFDVTKVRFNLDRIVDINGVSTASNNHPMMDPNQVNTLRTGAANPKMAGPLGSTLVRRLTDPTTGIVLESWIDADGKLQGNASNFVK